jgi:glycosyltransferase involved in cell wall biosynthesis
LIIGLRGVNKMQKVTVLIPCHNEEAGIADVIKKFPRSRLERYGLHLDIIVIDNCSTDKTAEVAKSAGARVIKEHIKGKGNAIRTGFRSVPDDADYVVMLDGDDTYDSGEINRMVEPLQHGFCSVVIGSRLGGKMHAGAMRNLNRAGNWFYTFLVRRFYRVNVTDVLTGYFAWKKEVIDDLLPHLKSKGFAIEMEMITKMAKLEHDIYSVPISYTPRSGETNLRPFYDGSKILKMLFDNLRWKPQVEGGLREEA